jgi:hypothetical protein
MQRLPVTIEDPIVAWVAAIHPDATIVWAKENAPRPAPPFVVLDIIAGPFSVGPSEERYKQQDTFTYAVRKRATLNLQVFADDALVRAAAVEAAIELPSRQSILQAAGIAVWGSEGVRDLTELLDTAFEPRAGLDLFLSWPAPVDDAPGEIRRVQATGTLDSTTIEADIDTEA